MAGTNLSPWNLRHGAKHLKHLKNIKHAKHFQHFIQSWHTICLFVLVMHQNMFIFAPIELCTVWYLDLDTLSHKKKYFNCRPSLAWVLAHLWRRIYCQSLAKASPINYNTKLVSTLKTGLKQICQFQEIYVLIWQSRKYCFSWPKQPYGDLVTHSFLWKARFWLTYEPL